MTVRPISISYGANSTIESIVCYVVKAVVALVVVRPMMVKMMRVTLV